VYSVPDGAPLEDIAICDLVNRGLQPKLLFKAAYTFYRVRLEEAFRQGRNVEVGSGLFQGMILSPEALAS